LQINDGIFTEAANRFSSSNLQARIAAVDCCSGVEQVQSKLIEFEQLGWFVIDMDKTSSVARVLKTELHNYYFSLTLHYIMSVLI
jgi:hypothetical protein